MGYEPRPIEAPRIAGTTLKLTTWLVENRVTGGLLAKKLLRDAGVVALREVAVDDGLPVYPPHLAREPHGQEPPNPPDEPVDMEPAVGLDVPASFPLETAGDFTRAYRKGSVDPVTVARRVLAAHGELEELAPPMRLLIAQSRDDVMAQAEASAARWAAGTPLGPLDGVPIVVKDEVDQTPYPTTVGTSFLGKEPAAEDATPVARLRAAGALLVGKGNMHEIGMGVTGVNPHHGACRNPWDPTRATGGSSSGPAASVAAGLCPIAVAADGGGSIRIPAAFCGILGLKPTFGRVSEHGAAPLCWSVAHVGPVAASARDLALGYALMAGPDPNDPNSCGRPPVRLDGVDAPDLAGVRVGVYRPWFDDADEDVLTPCREAVERLAASGATIVDIEIPDLMLVPTVHLVTIATEMAAAHARYYGKHRADYGHDNRLNLVLARRITGTDYVHAQRLRARIDAQFRRALEKVDVIATPMTGCVPPPIPADALVTGESNLPVTAAIMRFAQAANLTGMPALSLPAGYAGDLPVALQLIGRSWEEHLLLRIAAVTERSAERRRPGIHHRLLTPPVA